MSLLIYLLLLIISLILIFADFGGFWGAVWLPTKRENYELIISLINLKEGMIFYDLGSGTGDFLFYLAKKYDKVKFRGIEVSPILYLYSKIKSRSYKNVEIYFGNLFHFDISEADVIYVFLHQKMLKKLKEKITREAKKETLVIVGGWPFEGIKPLKTTQRESTTPYYLYLFEPKMKIASFYF